jgi:hypothetical protein
MIGCLLYRFLKNLRVLQITMLHLPFTVIATLL